MFKSLSVLLVMAFLLPNCTPKSMNDNTLYQSSAFTVYSDKVAQGKYEARAISRTELSSNYQSPANQRFSRLIVFKFSLNGKDNESPPGADHQLLLYPKNGQVTSPLLVFGQKDAQPLVAPENDFLEANTKLTLRLDMRPVLEAFEKEGFYTTYDGTKFYARDFKGVYVAGSAEPMSWDFENLPSRPAMQLNDPDKDGIYELDLVMNAYNAENFTSGQWKLTEDISKYPQYQSGQLLVDALYTLSLEELKKDIRKDTTFMAGAKWDGVWTRDISYSIVLAMASIEPEISQRSLMRKVKNGKIIQDTGSGGSWPVSTDRMTWALAAWEVYKVTGDQDWLKTAFDIIRKSAEDDLKTIVSPATGLFRGESSFLDWRKQTYPLWMEPMDIYVSQNLGTNAVHYQTYRILADMASLLGQSGDSYQQRAESIKRGVNQWLWQEEKGYYGQYLYGRNFLSLSPRAEALGEALCILFDIADSDRQARMIESTPLVTFGIPSIYPQIPGIPPYHNDAIWPFVQAYWTLAAAKTGNTKGVEQSMGAIYRAAALFLTNKENLVASDGDFKGTEINSDRQLWSVAGNLALVYKVLLGMDFQASQLAFNPVVPPAYAAPKTLTNFYYRNATLNIHAEGYGTTIKSFTLDGKVLEKAIIPGTLQGKHEIKIVMANDGFKATKTNVIENHVAPATPLVKEENGKLIWQSIPNATKYAVYRNGKQQATVTETSQAIEAQAYAEYQVCAIDAKGYESFLSEPVIIHTVQPLILEAEQAATSCSLNYAGHTGKGFVELTTDANRQINFEAIINEPGKYLLDFRYSNGSGPINTDNKCAIRTLKSKDMVLGVIVLPQRGTDEWSNWGYTNTQRITLEKGTHTFTLSLEDFNENMNGKINTAMLDHLRLIKIE